MSVKVYGASDDLIEVEGNISEEFDCYDEIKYLCFNEGTVLKVEYKDPGIWKIDPIKHGTATYAKTYEADSGSEDRGEGYTDIVTLDGVSSVSVGSESPLTLPTPPEAPHE